MTPEQFRSEPGLEHWSAGEGGAVATFRTSDFATGAQLFARIAHLAEAANHHPDVEVTYPRVRVTLITHSAGGLTAKDVALAQQISVAAGELGIEPDDE